jgi:hypothetical protein
MELVVDWKHDFCRICGRQNRFSALIFAVVEAPRVARRGHP